MNAVCPPARCAQPLILMGTRPLPARALAWICLLASLAFAPWTLAQVTVTVVLDQNQVLIGESVRVAVRVTNFSGQSLRLGENDDWLRFSIETPQGHLVARRGTVPVTEPFLLESSKVATKRVDVRPYFDLERPGRYLISAAVWIAEWGAEIPSQPVSVEVVRGTTLWEQRFGVPQQPGQSGAPEVRIYALQQAMHMKRMTLYARVTDAWSDRVHAVLPLGLLLSFSEPEKQIDRESNLHVLWQTGARRFNYSVVNPHGQLVIRQAHEYSDTRPVLRRDPQGRIIVGGGIRTPMPDDIPERPPLFAPTDPAPREPFEPPASLDR
jgi:hypothetical protein